MTERTLFYGEYGRNGGGRIIRTNLENGQSIELYNRSVQIYGMAVYKDSLFFIERENGIKSVSKNANGPVTAQIIATTGLDSCQYYYSMHLIEGIK